MTLNQNRGGFVAKRVHPKADFDLLSAYNSEIDTGITMSKDFSQYNDAEIWQAFKGGDEEAFKCIYDRYAFQLHSYGRHVAKDRELVEDCIHDLFVYLHEHRSTLGETDSIKYYLFRSLRRRIYETAKQQNKADSEAADDLQKQNLGFTPSPETELIEGQSVQLRDFYLSEAIGQLPKRQREALHLLYYEGLTYKEVASVMSLEVRTVYNQVHSAIELLKKKFHEPPLYIIFLGLSSLFLLG